MAQNSHAGGGGESDGGAHALLRRVVTAQESSIFLALVIISIFITIVAPSFLTARNAFSVSRQVSFLAIIAISELFVILTAGIDLSVGSVVGLSGVTTGLALAAGFHPLLAIAVGLLTGCVTGLINGILVAYVGVTPFIVTLGMLSMARGMVWILTKGWPITDIPESFIIIGQGRILGLPVPLLILAVVALLAYIVLKYLPFGRRVYAIGGNERATELSGINVRRIKLVVYTLSNILASITGIILVARFSSAQSSVGETWELDAIAAAVIGGTSLAGGKGSVLGVLIGAAIMGVIRNGLVLMKVSVYWQQFIIGMVIVLAAIIDIVRNQRGRS
ncbi:MAG: ABC transporter permease [Spirochaetaceae bacterium]